eukprot:5121098-Pyramimonas_sp.AAC.1
MAMCFHDRVSHRVVMCSRVWTVARRLRANVAWGSPEGLAWFGSLSMLVCVLVLNEKRRETGARSYTCRMVLGAWYAAALSMPGTLSTWHNDLRIRTRDPGLTPVTLD